MALIIPYQSQAGIQTANAGPAAQYRGAEDFYAASGGGSLSRGLQQLAGGTEKLGDVLFEETIRKRREVMELTLIKDVQNFQAEAQAWEDEYRKKNQGHNAIKAEEDAKDFYDKKINALEERWAGNGAALIHIRKNAGSMAVSGVNGMRDYGNEQMDAHRLAETNTQLATAQATFTSPNSTEEDRERDFNTWSRMHTYNLTKAGMPPERAQQEIEAVRKSLEIARFETRFKARLDSGDIEGARAELEDMQRRSAAGQTDTAGAAGTDEGAEAGGNAAGAAGTGEGAGMGAGGSTAAGAGAAGNKSGLTENGPDTAKAGANAGKDKIGPNKSETAPESAPKSGPGTGKTASKSAPESGPESALAGSAAAKSETGANAGEGKSKPPAKPPLLSPERARMYDSILNDRAQKQRVAQENARLRDWSVRALESIKGLDISEQKDAGIAWLTAEIPDEKLRGTAIEAFKLDMATREEEVRAADTQICRTYLDNMRNQGKSYTEVMNGVSELESTGVSREAIDQLRKNIKGGQWTENPENELSTAMALRLIDGPYGGFARIKTEDDLRNFAYTHKMAEGQINDAMGYLTGGGQEGEWRRNGFARFSEWYEYYSDGQKAEDSPAARKAFMTMFEPGKRMTENDCKEAARIAAQKGIIQNAFTFSPTQTFAEALAKGLGDNWLPDFESKEERAHIRETMIRAGIPDPYEYQMRWVLRKAQGYPVPPKHDYLNKRNTEDMARKQDAS